MSCYETLSIIAYFLTAAATAIYAYFAWGQWKTIGHQADIANTALRLAQRPKLRVRDVGVVLSYLSERDEFTPGPIRVAFEIANLGGFSASIHASHSEVILSNGGLPIRMSDERSPPNNVVGKRTLEPGDIHSVSFTYEKPLCIHRPNVWKRFYSSLYVVGYIDYRDELRMTRRTSFCRRFMRTDEGVCFAPEENPNYEYED